jgi:hypothetical protein
MLPVQSAGNTGILNFLSLGSVHDILTVAS